MSDVKVLDLTHYIAGPYCTKLLADYGAEVIKVENPSEGDGARKLGPFPEDRPHPEKSGIFLHLNTNKKGITLNLKTNAGIKIFKELVEWADILVENFAPMVMPSLGLDYQALRQINHRLVMTSISNFGQTGPYRDYKATEIVLFGMGGAMNATGIPERYPLKLAGSLSQYYAGSMAAVATMGAFIAGSAQGAGQHVDVSIMETLCPSPDRRGMNLLSYAYSGETIVFRSYHVGVTIMPHGRYACGDGFVEYAGAMPNYWPRWAKALEMPELLEDPRFKDISDLSHKDDFLVVFLPWLSERSKREAMKVAQNEGIPAGAIMSPGDLVNDPHFSEREFFVEIQHPEAGTFKYPGPPFRMERTPCQALRPAPLQGQDNEEVYCHLLGRSKTELTKMKAGGII